MQQRTLVLLFLVASLVFVPSPAVAQAGLCSDSRTIGLVKRVYRQSLDKVVSTLGVSASLANEIERLVPVEVKSVRTVRIDQGVGRHHCDATWEAKLTTQGSETVNDPVFQGRLAQVPELRGFQTKGALVTHPVHYTVQLTDDKKEIFVETVSFKDMAEFVYAITIREINDKMTQTPKPPPKPAPPPVRAATAKPPEPDTVEKSGICKGLDTTITVDHLDCLNRKFKVADDVLNASYKDLMVKLSDTQKVQLRTSQRAWIKEKESKCARAGEEVKGGTMEPILIADCSVQMTEQRVAYLKSYRP